MRTLSIVDARAHFGAVIGAVRFGGERVVLTNHGTPVAAIISADDLAVLRKAGVVKPAKRTKAKE